MCLSVNWEEVRMGICGYDSILGPLIRDSDRITCLVKSDPPSRSSCCLEAAFDARPKEFAGLALRGLQGNGWVLKSQERAWEDYIPQAFPRKNIALFLSALKEGGG